MADLALKRPGAVDPAGLSADEKTSLAIPRKMSDAEVSAWVENEGLNDELLPAPQHVDRYSRELLKTRLGLPELQDTSTDQYVDDYDSPAIRPEGASQRAVNRLQGKDDDPIPELPVAAQQIQQPAYKGEVAPDLSQPVIPPPVRVSKKVPTNKAAVAPAPPMPVRKAPGMTLSETRNAYREQQASTRALMNQHSPRQTPAQIDAEYLRLAESDPPEVKKQKIERLAEGEGGGIISNGFRGLATGGLMLGQSLGSIVRYAGGEAGIEEVSALGKDIEKYFEPHIKKYIAAAKLPDGNVFQSPELLGNAEWLSFQVGQMLPSLLAAMIPGGIAAGVSRKVMVSGLAKKLGVVGSVGKAAETDPSRFLKVGKRLLDLKSSDVQLKMQRIGRASVAAGLTAGGTVGGMLEGSSTYKETYEILKERGATDEVAEEVAGNAFLMMTAASGVLNAVGLEKFLTGVKGVKARSIRALVEATTEYLEGPAEAAIQYGQGTITPEEAMQKLLDESNVIPPAAILGFFMPGAGASFGEDFNKRIEQQTPPTGIGSEEVPQGPAGTATGTLTPEAIKEQQDIVAAEAKPDKKPEKKEAQIDDDGEIIPDSTVTNPGGFLAGLTGEQNAELKPDIPQAKNEDGKKVIEGEVTAEDLLPPSEKIEGKSLSGEVTEEELQAPEVAPEESNNQALGIKITEAPIDELSVSVDVPQIKQNADPETGVVKGQQLEGKLNRRGLGPIQIWVREDGTREVISGRHRLDLAKRNGEKTLPAQHYYEKDGFTAADGRVLDAKLNIQDEKGKVSDYTTFFKDTEITEETAREQGLLARTTGKDAWAIARGGGDETISAHRAHRLTDDQVLKISKAAPGDQALQNVGIKALQDGMTNQEAANMIHAVALIKGDRPISSQGDLLGDDDSGLVAARKLAKAATARQSVVSRKLSAIAGASKSPKLAAEYGVDISNVDAVKQSIADLKAERERLKSWRTDSALVAELSKEAGLDVAPQTATEANTEVAPPADDRTESLFGEPETEQELTARLADEKAKGDAKAAEKKADQDKLDADANTEDFNLAGSDQAADQATAAGQTDLLDTAQTEQAAPLPLPKYVAKWGQGKKDNFGVAEKEKQAAVSDGFTENSIGPHTSLESALSQYHAFEDNVKGINGRLQKGGKAGHNASPKAMLESWVMGNKLKLAIDGYVKAYPEKAKAYEADQKLVAAAKKGDIVLIPNRGAKKGAPLYEQAELIKKNPKNWKVKVANLNPASDSGVEMTFRPAALKSYKEEASEQAEAKQEEPASFESMVQAAQKWRGAAVNADRMYDEKDAKARLKHSKATTKGDLDAYLQKTFGIDEAAARDISNELTKKDLPTDESASVEEFAGEPWADAATKAKGEKKTAKPTKPAPPVAGDNKILFSQETPGTPEYKAAKDKGLDMSKKARMKRAEAMGFDAGTVWYHGTGSDVESFRRGKKGGRAGSGIYFAKKTAVPGIAAKHRARTEGGNANILPVYLKATNQYATNTHADDLLLGLDAGLLEEKGHTGVDVLGLGGEIVDRTIFDPSNIRSVNAAFDPANSGSSNILFSATQGTKDEASTTKATSTAQPVAGQDAAKTDSLTAGAKPREPTAAAAAPTTPDVADPLGIPTIEFSQADANVVGMEEDKLRFTVLKVIQAVSPIFRVRVIQSHSDFPENISSRIQKGSIIRGAHDADNKTVYLVADNIRDAKEAEQIMLHEMFGHGAMKLLPNYSAIRAKVESNAGNDSAIKEATDYAKSQRYAPADIADEAIAYLAETAFTPKGAWKGILGMMKAGLRTMGFKTKFTDADIITAIYSGRAALERRARQASIALSINTSAPGYKKAMESPEMQRFLNATTQAQKEITLAALHENHGDVLFSKSAGLSPKAEAYRNRIMETPNRELNFRDRVLKVVGEYNQDIQARLTQGIIDTGNAIKVSDIKNFNADKVAKGEAPVKPSQVMKLMDASTTAYKAYSSLRSFASVMDAVLRVGVPTIVRGRFQQKADAMSFQEVFAPLRQIPGDSQLVNFELWAVTNRALGIIKKDEQHGRKGKQRREKNIKKDEAEALMEELKVLTTKEGKSHYEIFEEVNKNWQEYNTDALNLAIAAGVIKESDKKIWYKNDYVPFWRATDDVGGVGAGIDVKSSGISRLRGGTDAEGNPLKIKAGVVESMFMNSSYLIQRSYRNEATKLIAASGLESGAIHETPLVAKHLLTIGNNELAEGLFKAGFLSEESVEDAVLQFDLMDKNDQNKWREFWTRVAPQGENIITVWNEGKPTYYTVTDKLFMRSMSNISVQQYSGIMKLMGVAKKLLTIGVVNDPAFMLANYMRDTVQTFVVSKAPMTPIVSAMTGFGEAYSESEHHIALAFMGRGGGAYHDSNPDDVAKLLKKLHVADIEKHQASVLSPKNMWRVWQRVGTASEYGNRLAIYDSLVVQWDRVVAKHMSDGMTIEEAEKEAIKEGIASPQEAGWQAQDLLNFTRSGDFATMQALIHIIPFLNARIQGLNKLYRSANEDPKSFMQKGAIVTLLTLALAAVNDDDERYEELEEWDKDTYFHFFIGEKHYRLPKPFEVGAIFATIPERMLRAMKGDDTWGIFAKQMSHMILETFVMNPVPQLARPALESWMNESFFTGGPIVSDSLGKLSPERQYDWRTGDFSRAIAESMPDSAPEFLRSPKQIEHLVRGYFGALGTYAMSAANVMTSTVKYGPADTAAEIMATPLYDAPVAKRFIRNPVPHATKYTKQVWEIAREGDKIARTMRRYVLDGDGDKALGLQRDNAAILRAAPTVRKVSREMGKITRQIDQLSLDMSIDPERRLATKDKLLQRRNDLAESIWPLIDEL